MLPPADSRRRALGLAALRLAALALPGLWLAGCQSAPPAADPAASALPGHPLQPPQIAVLQSEGFQPGDDGWALNLSGKLLFDFDADELNAESRQRLERLAHTLLAAGIDHLRIEGHTDPLGNAHYNERLSLRRAQAVARTLGAAGMPADRLVLRGYGASRPVAGNDTAAGRSENRRVAIVVPAQ